MGAGQSNYKVNMSSSSAAGASAAPRCRRAGELLDPLQLGLPLVLLGSGCCGRFISSALMVEIQVVAHGLAHLARTPSSIVAVATHHAPRCGLHSHAEISHKLICYEFGRVVVPSRSSVRV